MSAAAVAAVAGLPKSLLEWALYYASRGWHVFPLFTPLPQADGSWVCDCPSTWKDGTAKHGQTCKPGKHPRTLKGVLDATTDAAQIRKWWKIWPQANIGIALGPSGLLDIAPDSVDWAGEFIARGLPETPNFSSGGGDGHGHWLYQYTPADDVPRVRINRSGEYDLMTDGYAVAPPSRHEFGRLYDWRVRPQDVPLATARGVPWAVEELREHLGARRAKRAASAGGGVQAAMSSEPPVKLAEPDQKLWDGPDPDDRSGWLFAVACMLRRHYHLAPHVIEPAIRERDLWLGDDAKFAHRGDDDVRYAETVANAVAQVDAEPGPVRLKQDAGGEAPPPGRPQVDFSRFSPARDTERFSSWPAPLAEAAFYGPLGEFVRRVALDSEADPAGILSQVAAGSGAVLGAKSYATVGTVRHPPRLNTVLVGQTSKGRKGTAGAIAVAVAKAAANGFAANIVDGLSSGEGLIWAIRDPIPTWDKRAGAWVTGDPGISDKRLLVTETEFASTLRVLQRDGNSLAGVIRKAWDLGPDDVLQSLVKLSQTKATGAHVCITGHVPKEELLRYMDRNDLLNGFGNRFLWFAVQRAQELPFGEEIDPQIINSYALHLQQAREWAAQGHHLRWAPETRAQWAAAYRTLGEPRPGLYGAATARGEAQVLRWCVLLACLDKDEWLRPAHLDAALAVWTYVDATCRWVFGDLVGSDIADQILVVLRQDGPQTRDQIYNLLGRHTPRGKTIQALQLLADHGLAERLIGPSTGGRPPEAWRARQIFHSRVGEKREKFPDAGAAHDR